MMPKRGPRVEEYCGRGERAEQRSARGRSAEQRAAHDRLAEQRLAGSRGGNQCGEATEGGTSYTLPSGRMARERNYVYRDLCGSTIFQWVSPVLSMDVPMAVDWMLRSRLGVFRSGCLPGNFLACETSPRRGRASQ